MTALRRSRSPDLALRSRDGRAAAAAWRFDFALGIALAVIVSFAVLFARNLVHHGLPPGNLLLAWIVLLSGAALVVVGGIALRVAGRIEGATLVLGLLAGPVVVIGLAVSPFALWGTLSALMQPEAFRAWAGPDYAEKRVQWAIAVAAVGALAPVALTARGLGRTALWDGLAIGAVAMVMIVLFGIGGGFILRAQA